MNSLDIFQDEEIVTSSVISEEVINQLIEKCKESSIEYSYVNSNFIIMLSSGRSKYKILIDNMKYALNVLEIDFSKYVVLQDYLAICSYEKGTIEAIFEPIHLPYHLLLRKLFDNYESTDEKIRIVQETDIGNLALEIGKVSKELGVIFHSQIRRNFISIKLSGLNIKQHNKALDILKKVTDSLFFQIELRYKLPIILSKQNSGMAGGRYFKEVNVEELKFPKIQYNSEALSLYWYARSARRMPLLQYLAYYQSIEYYFPLYSDIEAKKTLKNMLMNPTFNEHNEADLSKVIVSIRTKLGGKGFANERTQLLSTLKECINPDEIRDFLKSSSKKEDFFSLKNEQGNIAKKLSNAKLTVNQDDTEIINNLKERIYDIRCKIVHTKALSQEDTVELILPFSKEAENLDFDVELLKLISQQVIITSGNQLLL
ncbi:hypothetical protein Amet_2381 [Alkaliphilus metalliredigens QYMF]|uniref:Uncharacterized protein n=2 Tax=Alkaliphilus TaxID=114627 RepID=A6TQR7_ALKMQ|nr:hypothetical protein Amet_2381 [Alkaliphilus metalliredigens QYMF]